jgi:hypothetical protein
MVGLTLGQLPLPGVEPGTPGVAVPADAAQPPVAGGEGDPLGTVGIALLAYGLVQLLSKVVDKLPVWKGGGADHPHAHAAGAAGGTDGFNADDRKRLERVLEQVMADHQRLERLEEFIRDVLESTRWMAEMRARDPRDGEPVWACRARGMAEQFAVQQRLIGQSLDELRTANSKLDNVLRKLRALWMRVGSRRKDRG